MGLTKKNGTKIKRSSKKGKVKKIKPVVLWGPKFRRTNNRTYVCQVNFKDQTGIVRQKITGILEHPVPSYASKKYIIKNVVLGTASGKRVRVEKKDKRSGLLFGVEV